MMTATVTTGSRQSPKSLPVFSISTTKGGPIQLGPPFIFSNLAKTSLRSLYF
jgi:hypothetical protein